MKRKVFSILFAVVLVLSFSLVTAVVSAAEEPVTVTTGIYVNPTVDLTVPTDNVVAETEFLVRSRAANIDGKDQYDVRFNITLSGPEAFAAGSTLPFIVTDAVVDGTPTGPQGIDNTFELIGGVWVGYWGPKLGFLMEAEDDVTVDFTVVMAGTAPTGEYTIDVELYDFSPEPDTVLATATGSFTLDSLISITIDPTDFDFGNLRVNEQSDLLPITITNGSTAGITVNAITESTFYQNNLYITGGTVVHNGTTLPMKLARRVQAWEAEIAEGGACAEKLYVLVATGTEPGLQIGTIVFLATEKTTP